MDDKVKPTSVPDQRPRGGSAVQQETADPGFGGAKARQGAVSGRIQKVLAVSTVLAAAAMLGTWWYFV